MPSQKPVEVPQEGPTHSLTDNTIPDNEHARKDASKQLERTRVEVAAELAEAKLVAEEARKKEVAEAKAKEKASVRAKESAITSTKQVKHTHATPKTQEKEKKTESKKRVVVSRSSKTQAPTKTFEATAYVAMCKSGCIGITASGYDVRNTIKSPSGLRIIAAPKSIPLGTVVRVNTGEESFNAVVLDRGGDIVEGRIDLLVGSEAEAFRFGRQTVTVQIIRKGGK